MIPNQAHGLLSGNNAFPYITTGDIRYSLESKFRKFAPNMNKIANRIDLGVLLNISLPIPFVEIRQIFESNGFCNIKRISS